MDNTDMTLRRFFGLSGDELTQQQRSVIVSSENSTEIKTQIEARVKEVKGSDAFDEIINQLQEISDISILDIMLGAWKKSVELLSKLQESTKQPKDSISFPLGEHTITSQHRPHIEVIVNGQLTGRIDFELNIKLTLKGCLLSIQNGEIRSIKTGACEAKGNVKCEGIVIKEKEWEPVSLPGKIILFDDTMSAS